MANAGEVVGHCTIEIQKEKIGRHRVGQRCSVIAFVLAVPVLQRIVVCVRQGNLRNPLIHLHELVRKGADRRQSVFLRKEDVGCANHIFGFVREPANNRVFPHPRQPSPAAEFSEPERIFACLECVDFLIKPIKRSRQERQIVKIHAEIDFVDNFQQINLELHRREQRATNLNLKFS